MRSSRLRAEGFADRAISAAVRSGSLVRVRRLWVALPDADAELLEAARDGVVLSCISSARRRGLWVLGEPSRHVAAAHHAGRVPSGSATRVHWSRPLVPRHPDVLDDSIENVLALIAECQPFESALMVWESAIRTSAVDPLVLGRLPLRGAASRLLAVAGRFSDSGLESVVVPRLAWLRIRIIPQAWIAGHRVDFLLGERLVLQIDGGHHVGAQRARDIRHDAQLTLAGYHVIRVGYGQMLDDWPATQELIMRAVAQGLHRAR